MQVLKIDKCLAVGGKGCRLCKSWMKYQDESFQRDTLGIVGSGWGKCMNRTNIILSESELERKDTDEQYTSNVNIKKLPVIGTIVSTSSTFSCSNYEPDYSR